MKGTAQLHPVLFCMVFAGLLVLWAREDGETVEPRLRHRQIHNAPVSREALQARNEAPIPVASSNEPSRLLPTLEQDLFNLSQTQQDRLTTLHTLSEIGTRDAIRVLGRAVESLTDLNESAAFALARIDTEEAGRRLIAAWDTICTERKDVFAGNPCLRALATMDPMLLEIFADELLSRRSADQRENLFLGFMAGAEPAFARSLASRTLRGSDEGRRVQALLMLGYVRGVASQHLLIDTLGSTSSDWERLEGLNALRRHEQVQVPFQKVAPLMTGLPSPLERLMLADWMITAAPAGGLPRATLREMQNLVDVYSKCGRPVLESHARDLAAKLTSLSQFSDGGSRSLSKPFP